MISDVCSGQTRRRGVLKLLASYGHSKSICACQNVHRITSSLLTCRLWPSKCEQPECLLSRQVACHAMLLVLGQSFEDKEQDLGGVFYKYLSPSISHTFANRRDRPLAHVYFFFLTLKSIISPDSWTNSGGFC